jgi:hypothetical protein
MKTASRVKKKNIINIKIMFHWLGRQQTTDTKCVFGIAVAVLVVV